MPARDTFVSRLEAFREALKSEALINPSLAEVVGSEAVRQLRNGLAVISFATLEDFVRTRTQEVLGRVGSTPLPFVEWPEPLQRATTLRASAALQQQLRWVESTEKKIELAQEISRSVASTVAAPVDPARFSFASEAPNLAVEDLERILEAFGVIEPWSAIGGLARRLNSGSLPLKESMRTALRRRNQAAHRAEATTEVTDLEAFAWDAMVIAISFDALLSRGGRRLLEGDREWARGKQPVKQRDVGIRYLLKEKGRWKEKKDLSSRAVRTNTSLDDLLIDALTAARREGDLVVVLGDELRPVSWRTADLE